MEDTVVPAFSGTGVVIGAVIGAGVVISAVVGASVVVEAAVGTVVTFGTVFSVRVGGASHLLASGLFSLKLRMLLGPPSLGSRGVLFPRL